MRRRPGCLQFFIAVMLVWMLFASPPAHSAKQNLSWREKVEAVLQRGSTPEIREGLVLGAVLEVQGAEQSDSGRGDQERGRWSGRWIEALSSSSREMDSERPPHQLANLINPQGRWTVEVRYLGEMARNEGREQSGVAILPRENSQEATDTQGVEITWRRDGEISHREFLSLKWGVTSEAQYHPMGGNLMRAYVKLVKVRY